MSKIDWKSMADEAAEMEDQTEVSEGGGSFALPDEGVTVGRLVEYIELGMQPQKPYQGKPKQPVEKVRITFELLTEKHVREITTEDGTKKIANRVTITIPKLLGEKAQFRKLFDKMRNKRDGIKNMAQMIGEGFKLTVVHNTVGDKTYANIKDDNGWLVNPPTIEITDADGIPTGKFKTIKIPEAIGEVRLFLWKAPNRAQWDSLFIDGSREVKDAKGNTVVKTNNFIQDTIKSALNFEGSALFDLLSGADDMEEFEEEASDDAELETEDDSEDETEEDDAEEAVEETKPAKTTKPDKASGKKETKKEEPKKKKKVAAADEDDLAALGLV